MGDIACLSAADYRTHSAGFLYLHTPLHTEGGFLAFCVGACQVYYHKWFDKT